jgi:Putative Ig domain
MYLIFYNAATAAAATELAIFRYLTPTDLIIGSQGVFPTAGNPAASNERDTSFLMNPSNLSLLIGQNVNGQLRLGSISNGIGPITSATTLTMNAGSTRPYQILSNNGANSFTVTSLPAWASLDSATGVITLAPGSDITGTFALGLSAINSLTGSNATGSLAVTVQTTTGPAFTSSAAVSATAGIFLSHTITTDASSSFAATSALPAGLTFDTSTGVLSGIPRSTGSFPITIRAARTANAASFTDQNLVLTVTSPTLAISALVSGQLNRTVGTAYSIPVTIPAGFGVDSGSITPTISGVTYSAGNLLISSTAAPFAKGTTSQATTLTLTRTSGLDGATVSASLPFNLRLVAPAPTALTAVGPFEVNVGEDYSLQLSTDLSTLCPNQNIAIVGTLPAGLNNNSAGLRKTGLITGKNTSTTLPYEFTVDVVADTSTFYEGGGALTVPVVFRLRNPVAPVITSALTRLAGVGRTFAQYTITADGSPSRFTANGLPPGIVLNGANLNGTPTQAGNYDVRLEAYNSFRPGSTLTTDLQSGTATLRIFVSGSKPTTATPLSGSSNLQAGRPASFSMLSAQQLGLRISGYGFPPGLTIDSSTGLVTGTPTAAGTYSVTVFIQNGKGWIKKTVPLIVR